MQSRAGASHQARARRHPAARRDAPACGRVRAGVEGAARSTPGGAHRRGVVAWQGAPRACAS
eukprot:scaffold98_cov64-Phaeocystis_antarctica.AAC.1